MLKNYFKIALRSLLRNKAFSVINILGLGIGITAFLLIMHYVQFERSYESGNRNADHMYRVTLDMYNGGEFVVTDCETHPPFGPTVKSKYPEVEDFVRVQTMEQIREVGYQDKKFLEEKIYAVDPSVFDLFDLHLIRGNQQKALRAPLQVVITESIANKYFGNLNVIGKSLSVKPYREQLEIVGVIKDLPLNTHLKMDFLISFATLKTWGWNLENWNGNNNYTYLKLSPEVNLSKFNEKLKSFSKIYLTKSILVAEPIKQIHLHSNKTFEPETNGNAQSVNFLLIIAILIILIVSINYINLTTAKSIERAREIGIRKIIGSSKSAIILQSIVEFILINLAASVLALLLILFSFSFYWEIIGKQIPMDLFQNWSFWKTLLILFCLNIILSGLYPALVLSSTRPITVIGRKFTGATGGKTLRKALVVCQFAITFILITGTIVIYQQVRYMRDQHLGMNTEEVLVVRAPAIPDRDSLGLQKIEVFKNQLLNNPNVVAISSSESLPGVSIHELNTTTVRRFGQDLKTGYNYYLYGIDSAFIPLMNMEIEAGTNFTAGSALRNEVIVNEQAAKTLGFKDSGDAVGKQLTLWSDNNPTIIGVVKNFHQQSLKDNHLPMIHWYHQNGNGYISLKIKTDALTKTIGEIRESWNVALADFNFDYYFLDEMFDQQYKADQQFGKTIAIFSGIAIFLASLGLLGLISYNTQQRTKEIGVRKVLGASIANITALLSKDYLRLISLSILIALPIAYYAMSSWLQGFAYRIHLYQHWWIFVFAGFIAISIAMLTVSVRTIKAAVANPVDSLRSE